MCVLSHHRQVITYCQPNDYNGVLFKDDIFKSQSHILCVVQNQLILYQRGNGCNHEESSTSLNLSNTHEDLCTIIHVCIYTTVYTQKSNTYLLAYLFAWSAWDESKEYLLWVPYFKGDKNSSIAQMAKNLPAVQETQVQSLGQEYPLEKEMAIHSSILAWRIPWTEEAGGLQSMG